MERLGSLFRQPAYPHFRIAVAYFLGTVLPEGNCEPTVFLGLKLGNAECVGPLPLPNEMIDRREQLPLDCAGFGAGFNGVEDIESSTSSRMGQPISRRTL